MLNLEPGRELDALVAEKVMGFVDIVENKAILDVSGVVDGRRVTVGAYSSNMCAAWEVVEKITKLREINSWELSLNLRAFVCEADFHVVGDNHSHCFVTSKTSAPHAICLAALKAVGYKDNEV